MTDQPTPPLDEFGNPAYVTDQPTPQTDPLKPSVTLLIKLGSILVHAEEAFFEMDRGLMPAYQFDRGAFDSLDTDPEVVAWKEQMSAMAFLPVKR